MNRTSPAPQAIARSHRERSSSWSVGPGRIAGGMSGVPGRRGRRNIAYAAPRTKAAPISRAMAMVAPRAPEIAASVPAVIASPHLTRGPSHAEGSFGRLVGRVRSPGRARDDAGGVHAHRVARHGELEAVQAGGGRPQLVLAGLVVLRAVARALEPLAGLTEGHPATQVDALLVESHQA